MILIGLTGQKRSGKDTCADFIAKNYNGSKLAFAELLRQVLVKHSSCLGIKLTLKDFEGNGINREKDLNLSDKVVSDYFMTCVVDLISNYGLQVPRSSKTHMEISSLINNIVTQTEFWSIRKFLQKFGTDLVVELDKGFWVKHVVSVYVDKYINTNEKVFIASDCRQQHEIDTIRQLGGTIIHIIKNTGLTDSHITEQPLAIKESDIIIKNDSSLADFYTKISSTLKSLKVL